MILQTNFDGGAPSGDEADQASPLTVANNARILVAGGATFLSDSFLSQQSQAFILNLTDWLLLDEALLKIRSRGLASAAIDELDEGARRGIKYGNILGLPMALVALGLVRWRRREHRRTRVSL